MKKQECGASAAFSIHSKAAKLAAELAASLGASCWVPTLQRADLPGRLPEGSGRGVGDIHGEGEPRALPCEPPLLSPLRYQEVQAAQEALGTAAAEALPEAGRVLAAAQQADADAALRPASLAAPAGLVSPAVLGALRGVGGGECGSWETSAAQAEADDVAYF